MKERLALDVGKWDDPQKAVEDFSLALIEQREGPLSERIGIFKLFLNRKGKLESPVFGEVEKFLRHETSLDELENQAVGKITDWSRKKDSGYLLWISPPNLIGAPEVQYRESRFVIYELVTICDPETKEVTKELTCRAICTDHAQEECLSIAAKLDKNLRTCVNPDILRATPIEFFPIGNQSWTNYLKKYLDYPEIWRKIRKKDDIKMQQETSETAKKIVDKYFYEIKTASNAFELVVVGAKMEQEAKALGFPIQFVGSCGISNSYALQLMTGRMGPFEVFYSGLASLGKNLDKWSYHKGTCRICNQDTQVGPCKICKECEKKFD